MFGVDTFVWSISLGFDCVYLVCVYAESDTNENHKQPHRLLPHQHIHTERLIHCQFAATFLCIDFSVSYDKQKTNAACI